MKITKNKIIVLITALFVVTGIYLFIKNNKRFNLVILTTPSDNISVYVNDKIVDLPSNIRLKKGNYTLRIYKDGYFEEKAEVFIDKDLTYKFNLIKKTSIQPRNPVNIGDKTSTTSSGEYLISMDNQSRGITIFRDQASPVGNFSLPDNLDVLNFTAYQNRILLISDVNGINPKALVNRYFIYDINLKSILELDLEKYKPIVSLSFSTKEGFLLIAGKYDIKFNKSTVYLYNVFDNTDRELLTNNSASAIYSLNNERLLLVTNLDAERNDSMGILDTTNNRLRTIYTRNNKIENPVVSNFSNKFIYNSYEGIAIYDYDSFTNNVVYENPPENTLYFWLDATNIAVINTAKSTIQKINIDSLSFSEEIDLPSLPNKELISVSVIGNKVFYNYMDLTNFGITILSSEIGQ